MGEVRWRRWGASKRAAQQGREADREEELGRGERIKGEEVERENNGEREGRWWEGARNKIVCS